MWEVVEVTASREKELVLCLVFTVKREERLGRDRQDVGRPYRSRNKHTRMHSSLEVDCGMTKLSSGMEVQVAWQIGIEPCR
jgi:hypothetical protein